MCRRSLLVALLPALAWACVGSASTALASGGAGTRAPAIPAIAPGNPSSVRGIVQSVSPGELVVRALDGSTITVAVDASARVRVNDTPAPLLAIRPGFVVVVTQHGQAPLTIDAYGAARAPAHVRPLVGTVRSVSADSLVLVVPGRGSVAFVLDSAGRILVDGKASAAAQVAVGSVAAVRPAAGAPRVVYELDAFSPPRVYGGTIAAVTATKLVVRVRPGRQLRFRVVSLGRIYLNGSAASPGRLRPGLSVVVRTAPHGEVWAFGTG